MPFRTDVESPASTAAREEAELVTRLRAGDERSFEQLVDTYHNTMLGVARTYVRSRAVAEEVVQDAWVGVLNGLDRFEGRSSLKTWILRIVVNTAMTRGGREARSVPFSALVSEEEDPAVAAERFRGPDDGFPGHWRSYPKDWRTLPEQALSGRETLDRAKEAIAALPVAQRTVITLRDIEGWSAEEVCTALEISDGNQRVLLHRARSHVRAELERHFDA